MSDFGPGVDATNEVVPLLKLTAEQRKFASWSSGFDGHSEKNGGEFTGFTADVSASNATGSETDVFDAAYKKGWEDGQRALAGEQADGQRQTAELVDAIRHLNDLHSASSFELILKAVESLFQRCSELAIPDGEILQSWARQLASLVDQDQKDATLHLHPEDLSLIDEEQCHLALQPDETMLRGNLKLSHAGGWIEKGSEVVLDELRALIDEFYEKEAGQPQ